jgi:glycosyltransferase involved in cell wall biosynthesis
MGGAERVILELVRGLGKSYDIHIIITEKTLASRWIGRFHDAVNIIDLAQTVRFPANKVPYIEQYVVLNRVDFVIISNSFDGYRAIPAIKQKSSSTKIIDILHGQGGKVDKGSSPLFSLPYHKLIDRRVTVTEYLRHYMHKQFGLNINDFQNIPNGVRISTEYQSKKGLLRKQLSIPTNAIIIAWLGRFNDEKKPFLGLEVAKQVLSGVGKNTVFVFGGDGPQKKQMEEFIQTEGLIGKVLLPGPFEDPEVLLADSYALIMTSEMEGMPLAILEAEAAGVPIITTSVGGIPEIVNDEASGFLIDFDDNSVKNFSTAIEKLLTDVKLRNKLAENAKQLVAGLTVESMVAKYEKLLKDLSI